MEAAPDTFLMIFSTFGMPAASLGAILAEGLKKDEKSYPKLVQNRGSEVALGVPGAPKSHPNCHDGPEVAPDQATGVVGTTVLKSSRPTFTQNCDFLKCTA